MCESDFVAVCSASAFHGQDVQPRRSRPLQSLPSICRQKILIFAIFCLACCPAIAFNPSSSRAHASARQEPKLASPRCCADPADLAAGLQANLAEHDAEIAASEESGFFRATAAVPVGGPKASYQVPRIALGMGAHCPFDSDELIFESPQLFTAEECRALRDEATAHIANGAQSTFSMTNTNRDVHLHDLSRSLSWLNSGAFARVASFAAKCFPSAVDNVTDLWIYDGLVIQYDARKGLTQQPTHRDGSLISCVIPLSERQEYEGGGTYIEPLDRSIRVEQGCALMHPSALRHGGQHILSGERWVLVLFLNSIAMKYAEHGRRFRERASKICAESEEELEVLVEEEEEVEEWIPEQDDEDMVLDDEENEEVHNLLHALRVTDETDYEVWYELGSRAQMRGHPAEALKHYQRAEALNPRDARVLGNMGVAYYDLERPREALRCYRRALTADSHDVSARFNAGVLLLQLGRRHGLKRLLNEMPTVVKSEECWQMLVEEAESVDSGNSAHQSYVKDPLPCMLSRR
mmetsp:Transcript_112405/g.204689  ORF Transcript_112405/g.204689 Transcript_112405/m.204689 type:complete len:522 (+) Transcript_112405:43-1608(+)